MASFDKEVLDSAKKMMSEANPGDWNDQKAKAEFLYQQTLIQIDMADYAKKQVRWMLLSVVVLALSALGTFIIGLIR